MASLPSLRLAQNLPAAIKPLSSKHALSHMAFFSDGSFCRASQALAGSTNSQSLLPRALQLDKQSHALNVAFEPWNSVCSLCLLPHCGPGTMAIPSQPAPRPPALALHVWLVCLLFSQTPATHTLSILGSYLVTAIPTRSGKSRASAFFPDPGSGQPHLCF